MMEKQEKQYKRKPKIKFNKEILLKYMKRFFLAPK